MEDPDAKKPRSPLGNVDDVISIVMPYVTDAKDRESASLVNRAWLRADSETRDHVTMALCYASSPDRLSRRFPNLRSIKIKGKPRAAMFNLIPENWGGFVTPWVNEIALSLGMIRSVHFRRMIVSDLDLDVLARARLDELEVLKLDRCLGFSTDGLLSVVKHCRKIKTLLMEDSSILEKNGDWLHELALHNTSLEVLNFYLTELTKISPRDLAAIAKNCHRSLVSVKISDIEILELARFFQAAVNLEEFLGGTLDEDHETPEKYMKLKFPPKLSSLGLSYLGANEMQIVFPFAAQIRKLDLLYVLLVTNDHCKLIQKCPNLEVLETRNVIGDKGLEVCAKYCKKLKRLRIERVADGDEMDDERRFADEDGNEDLGGLVTQRGLKALAHGCRELEYMAVYVSDITNEALRTIGAYLKNLRDFRLVLLDQDERITEVADFPLDKGVRSLLMGCEKLRRFALYLRPGGLTNVGLSYIGKYSPNVRWMLLGKVGETDEGLMEFSRGRCPKQLQKLEMRGCRFSERAIAAAVMELPSLRYLWVQGYGVSMTGEDLRVMSRPYWNIELIQARRVPEVNEMGDVREVKHPAHILAYYSLAGHRTDCPPTVRVLKEL
ncbi:Transport inhibitor response 1 domain-containing protein [Hirschfeldia incana]|nr:Transport inhibitor response 1 domain-containing protein [Hirschfeldia incana]